ncbi:MAG: tRNA epoxyqueuosine(34) reductase QueG [Gammaproteobacteria bacterium]|nr:tRNA epoxyqueuosine(34) reductase QueG [Gammaproteobacteria bacterium]
MSQPLSAAQLAALRSRLDALAAACGFDAVGVAGIHLDEDGANLERWLAAGWHGDMRYMARHGAQRWRPAELVPGTLSVICVRMNCWPAAALAPGAGPAPAASRPDGRRACIARYALGRDYHRILRPRLQALATRLAAEIGAFGYRAFVDSAPVLEKPLARDAGLGWIGRHTCLVSRGAGSGFVLGELFTDLPLSPDQPARDHCGSCSACLRACPTGAIVAPYRLDARRCISYLTIEHHGPIPEDLRALIGNRIFGCDDCVAACPWNKFARPAAEPDFRARHGLDAPDLVALFGWSEAEYLANTTGSALRRPGYWRWRRNLAVALGNAPRSPAIAAALAAARDDPHPLVREHVAWALRRQTP